MPPQTNNLTPSLTLSQLQENITALQKGGQQNPQVQAYVNNYKNNGDGTYSLNQPVASTAPSQPTGFLPSVNADLTTRGQNFATAIEKPAQVAASGAGALPVVKAIGEAGLNAAGEVAGGIGDFITEGVKALTPQPILDMLSGVAESIGGTAPVQAVAQKWNDFATAHPDAARDLGSVLNIGTVAAIPSVGESVEPAITKASGALADTANELAVSAGAKATDKALQESIAAIDPDLSGKSLTKAYEKGALQGTLEKGGILKTQTTGIAPDIQKLGTSLSDIGLKPNDPTGNLVKLGKDMNATEAKIEPFNSYPVSNGIKNTLTNELEGLKTSAPLEFSGIKESQSAYENVINYAKELVQKSPDTVGGYRNTRTLFDNQARLEFPGAFDDKGFINLKTPTGQAIKSVRDTLNTNLYEIAPKNSNLQAMIGREADIYKAIHNIAPSAAKLDGLNAVQKALKVIRQNPVTTLAGGYVGDKILKGLTGIGIPGL